VHGLVALHLVDRHNLGTLQTPVPAKENMMQISEMYDKLVGVW
jgi:hypothetical protein